MFIIKIILIASLLSSPFAGAQYWAKLDYSRLQSNEITAINLSKQPLKCKVRIYNDAANFYLGVSAKKTLNIADNVRVHNISLQCSPSKKSTTSKAWRVNQYQQGSAGVNHNVFR